MLYSHLSINRKNKTPIRCPNPSYDLAYLLTLKLFLLIESGYLMNYGLLFIFLFLKEYILNVGVYFFLII